jgi:hypothetical protein
VVKQMLLLLLLLMATPLSPVLRLFQWHPITVKAKYKMPIAA